MLLDRLQITSWVFYLVMMSQVGNRNLVLVRREKGNLVFIHPENEDLNLVLLLNPKERDVNDLWVCDVVPSH